MSDCNETVRILNAESQDQMNKAKEAEILRILKLRLVLQELRKIRVAKMDLIDGGEQVERALKVLNIAAYLNLDDKDNEGDFLLDLQEGRTINLSYTDRKALRQQLTTNLEIKLKPIASLGQKLRTEIPELFITDPTTAANSAKPPPATCPSTTTTTPTATPTPTEESGILSTNGQIIALEAIRRENLQKLAILRNKKCGFLKAAAELKMGPYLGNELDLLYANARLNHTKTNLLRGYFVNEFCSRTEHSLKAIKEVEGYISKALDQTED